jgi:restriction system protein
MPNWSDYQEETADFFRSIGLEATTNETVKGVRTSHDVDVVVRTNHVGFNLLWLIECKHWSRPVSKLHVLALREIVVDTGADRGIMMAENGYQSGALEAAQLTNVQLTSLAELSVTASSALYAAQLQLFQERAEECLARYWNLDKETRIAYGLRPPAPAPGYSGDVVVRAVQAALNSALRGKLPIACSDPVDALSIQVANPTLLSAKTVTELIDIVIPMITELEERLNVAYRELGKLETTG